MVDSHIRSAVKTISWRVIGTLINSLLIWLLTGNAGLGALIGIVDTGVKVVVYYAHERAWNRVRFGRSDSTDYQI